MAADRDLEEVIRGVQRGERELFEQVIRDCHVMVRAVIWAAVRDRDDADDLAQQTFIFAFEHITDYRSNTRFRAWLKAIARNMVRDYHKRLKTQRAARERYRAAAIAMRALEATGAERDDPRIEALERCVEDLTGDQRAFLRRAHGRPSTLEDLALELGRTGTAIRKHLSRLHALLRDCINKQSKSKEAGTA